MLKIIHQGSQRLLKGQATLLSWKITCLRRSPQETFCRQMRSLRCLWRELSNCSCKDQLNTFCHCARREIPLNKKLWQSLTRSYKASKLSIKSFNLLKIRWHKGIMLNKWARKVFFSLHLTQETKWKEFQKYQKILVESLASSKLTRMALLNWIIKDLAQQEVPSKQQVIILTIHNFCLQFTSHLLRSTSDRQLEPVEACLHQSRTHLTRTFWQSRARACKLRMLRSNQEQLDLQTLTG